ncbi:MAG TPA: DUF6036 family nucleotidyltransferase [Candidatus Limnocylindrales bacterium]|nr:DUF6036 family nucleotidyltransferase [Candidatus Limnocylindrales bacterium]
MSDDYPGGQDRATSVNGRRRISAAQELRRLHATRRDRHIPENYTDRMTLMFPTAFRRLLLLGLEAHDLALSKLERNSARDREDIKYLARVAPLDLSVLERRYEVELRPYLVNTERHDLTMRLWLEMLSGA